MELKLIIQEKTKEESKSFNRTFMELKLVKNPAAFCAEPF